MKLTLRRYRTNNMDIIKARDFSLPFIIEAFIKEWLKEKELPEILFFDLVEKNNIISIYIDTEQIKGMAKGFSLYIVFACEFRQGEYNGISYCDWLGRLTYYDSNVIDSNEIINFERYI